MNNSTSNALFFCAMLAVIVIFVLALTLKHDPRFEQSKALVYQLATRLDSQTTDTGAYIREDVKENDAWGQPISVTYTKGGLAEMIEVRSAGADGLLFTGDDIEASRSSVNISGVGTGVKKNIEETAENGSTGFFRGAIKGLKQGFKE